MAGGSLGDGGPKWGTGRSNRIDQGDVQLDEARLRELHLPPYQEAIQAGVASIMVSYGKWNGLELHHHHYLLSTLLKGELGFDGFVVSDANGFYESGQVFQERILSAALAGIDLFMLTSDQWVEFLPGMTAHVEAGNLPLS